MCAGLSIINARTACSLKGQNDRVTCNKWFQALNFERWPLAGFVRPWVPRRVLTAATQSINRTNTFGVCTCNVQHVSLIIKSCHGAAAVRNFACRRHGFERARNFIDILLRCPVLLEPRNCVRQSVLVKARKIMCTSQVLRSAKNYAENAKQRAKQARLALPLGPSENLYYHQVAPQGIPN